MKITIEFKDVNEYLEFKEKTAQEVLVQEQLIGEHIHVAEGICQLSDTGLTPGPY